MSERPPAPRSRGNEIVLAVGAAVLCAPIIAGFVDGWQRPPAGWEHGASRWVAAAAEGFMGHVILLAAPSGRLLLLNAGAALLVGALVVLAVRLARGSPR